MTAHEFDPEIASGPLEVIGQLIEASNASLLCHTSHGLKVIYKPMIGERPLWDFPEGTLSHREVAAYLASEALGLHLVPFTTFRDGPYGMGSVQRWVDMDEDFDLLSFAQSTDISLRSLALFDAIINNTDRKFGHILKSIDGSLYGCDHGVSFHSVPKLRTVLWQWAGEELTESERSTLALVPEITKVVQDHLSDEEIDALVVRSEQIMRAGNLPYPSDEWPAVPWPPF
jgi:hypothetical protein